MSSAKRAHPFPRPSPRPSPRPILLLHLLRAIDHTPPSLRNQHPGAGSGAGSGAGLHSALRRAAQLVHMGRYALDRAERVVAPALEAQLAQAIVDPMVGKCGASELGR
jgi:hypothetical protein